MPLADVQMPLVPDMQDVEHAVCQHHLLALRTRCGGDFAQFAERLDFLEHRSAVLCSLAPDPPIGVRDR